MKKALLLILPMLLVTARYMQSTGAYFTSQAVAGSNTISSTNMELLLSDTDETEQINISQSWGASHLKPGEVLPEGAIVVKNTSTINADHLDMTFSYTGNEELAKNIIFNSQTMFGNQQSDFESIMLVKNLLGTPDSDYILKDGLTGNTLAQADGIDGTTPDDKISLSELATLGKIRIQPGDENNGIFSNSEATLWLNAYVDSGLTAQNESVDVTITFDLEQHASQY